MNHHSPFRNGAKVLGTMDPNTEDLGHKVLDTKDLVTKYLGTKVLGTRFLVLISLVLRFLF